MERIKRWISCLLVCCMVMSMLPATVLAETTEVASGTCGENLTWELDSEGTLTISGTGDMSCSGWEDYRAQIKNVVIAEGVTGIAASAFYECTNLTNVTIPNTVTSIGDFAFDGCSSLTSIAIPESVTSIGQWAFSGCSSLTSIAIPEGVTSIGDNTFAWCANLESITIPEGVTSIGGYVFNGCSSLTGITIPDSVTSIGEWAFYNCTSLASITIPDGVTCIDEYLFHNCTNLTSVTIPDGVTSIGSNAFNWCSSLTSITIPDSVTSIGSEAFYCCNSLISIIIPENVTSIGEWAFYSCDNLTTIIISESVTSIGSNTFGWCANLTSITIPKSITNIGDNAFYCCSSLTDVNFTGDAPTIGSDAFVNVTATAYYPADNTTWTEDVMQGYGGTLTWVAYEVGEDDDIVASGTCGENLTWELDSTNTLTISGTGAMYDFAAVMSVPWYSYSGSIQNVVIEDGVTSIGDYAFYGFQSMTNVTMPDSITRIGYAAFYTCEALSGLEIPNSVTIIDDWAFSRCNGLTSITIPDSVTSIGEFAFLQSSGMISVTIPASVTNIGVSAFGLLEHLADFSVDSNNLYYSSDDQNALYDKNQTILHMVPASRMEYTAPETVQTIEAYTFYSLALNSVTLGENICQISSDAFSYCAIDELYFTGDAPETIAEDAFVNAEATVYYPANNETWTEDVMQDYGGTITWVAYGPNDFKSFEELKQLVAENQTEYIGAVNYIGTEPLVIEEDIRIPWTMGVGSHEQPVIVPEGVTLQTDNLFYATELTINGTMTAVAVEIGDALTVNGALSVNAQVYLYHQDVVLTGEENINFQDSAILCLGYDVSTMEQLMEALETAEADTNSRHVYSVAITEEMTIDQTLTLPANFQLLIDAPVTIADGCTLTTGYICGFRSDVTVEGTLVNTNGVNILHNDLFSGSLTIADGGEYTGTGIIRVHIPGGDDPTVVLSGIDTSHFDVAFDEQSGGWIMTPNVTDESNDFKSFEELKQLVAENQTEYIGAVNYIGTEPLVIEEDICIPWTMGVGSHEQPVIVPEGVTLQTDNLFYATELTIDGTMNAVAVEIGDALTVNGALSVNAQVYLYHQDVVLTGEENINFQDSAILCLGYDVSTMEQLMEALETAEADTNSRHVYSVAITEEMTIDQTLTLPGNFQLLIDAPVTIADGCTLTTGYICGFRSDVTVEGTLVNTDGVNILHNDLFSGSLTIADGGEYTGTGIIRVHIPGGDDPTVVLSGIDTSHFDVAFDEQSGGWILTPTSGTCGENLTWVLDSEGTLTISGTGSMYNYGDGRPCPWDSMKNQIVKIDIQEGATSVGDWTFIGCSNLTELKLPGTMKSLGDYAFYDCSGLKQLVLPDGLVSIGASSFNFCMGLESVVIPDSVETIGFNAFTFCSNLKSVVIGNGVKIIDGSAFAYDYNLSELVMGSSVEVIGQEAFCGCDILTELTIPASVREIQTHSMPTYLSNITFLGDAPEFPASVNEETGESYSNQAFYGITATAYYPAGNETWTEEVMQDYGGTITWIAYGEPSEPVGPVITRQPVDYVGLVGDTATFTVAAEGEELSHQWYFYDSATSKWSKSSSATSATLSVEFKSYRNNQQYRCEITDAEGNTVVTDTVKITAEVMDLVITSQPVSYVGAVNDELTFTVEATGNGLVYQWYFSDDIGESWKKSGTPGFNTATLKPILRSYRDGYQYYCQITDVFGNTINSDVVSATVKAGPVVITAQPADVTDGVLSQLYTFQVTAEGDNLTYRWEYSEDGGETWQESWNQGYETDTLTVRMHAYRSGNQYRCKITSGLKTVVYTEPAVLTLQSPSAAIVKQPANVAVVSGKTASFIVEATGNNLTYQWYRSNDNGASWTKTYLGGYSTNNLSFAANAGRAALYKCQITDGSGQIIWSNPVKLQILSAELQILTQPENVTCDSGATATFTVKAQGDSLKYQWYSSADGGATWTASYLSGYNTAEFSFAVNTARAAKVYKCVITDAGGNTVETSAVSVTIGQ